MGNATAEGSGGGASSGAGKKEMQLLSVSWNQDSSCFSAATTADFRIFRCHPFRETLRRFRDDGHGFAGAEMLFRFNIFATFASSSSSRSRDRFTVEVWDDVRNERVWQRCYSTAVRAVRMSRNRLVVVLDFVVWVYDLFRPARPPCKALTAPNPRGLCCLSSHSDATSVMACPGTFPGQVRVEQLDTATRFIDAHSSDLACMAMTVDGTVLATASVKGTIIRVFNTMDGTCLQKVRRGRDNAEICSIAISRDVKWLAASSDKGTVHIFSLVIRVAGRDEPDVQSAASVPQTDTVSNARSSLSFMKGVLPNYFSSEWSFGKIHLSEVTRCIVAFGEQNTVMIVGMDGRYSFDPRNGGEMVREVYFRFLKDKNPREIRTLITN